MPLRRVLASSWVPMVLTSVGIAAILAASGAPLGDVGRYGLYLLGAVAFPGVLAWRMLLARLHTGEDPPPTWFEDLSLGTIFGFGLQLPVYLVGVWSGLNRLFLVVPLLVLVLSVATSFGRRVWTLPTRRLDVRVAWALGLVVLYGLAWLAEYVFVLRPLGLPPSRSPSIDETFHQALIAELMHRFPPQIPWLLGTPLDYHWFAHAQLAATTWATDIKSDLLLRQLFPATMVALTVLGLGAVALRLSGRPVAAVVAPTLLVLGGFYLIGPFDAWVFNEAYLSKRLVSSPSQAYGFTMALPAMMLIFEVLRPGRRAGRLTWLTLGLALVALSGAKATFLPLFLCGALGLWAVRLVVIRRSLDRAATGLVVVLACVTAFAQVVLFGGSSGAMAFEPFRTVQAALHRQQITDTLGARAAMTATLLIGWLLYGVGALALRRRGLWSDRRATWVLCAIPPGIIVALVLFRSGLSQLWFQRSTAELVVLLSAWGIASLLPDPLPPRVALRLLAVSATAGLAAFAVSGAFSPGNPERQSTLAALIATVSAPVVVLVVVSLLYRLKRSGARVLAPSLAGVLAFVLGLGGTHAYAFAYDTVRQQPTPERTYPRLFAAGGAEAARWLARHSANTAVVATNVHCLAPKTRPCDNRNFWVSAYSERRVVVEGWGYTAETNSSAVPDVVNAQLPFLDTERLAVNDAALREPSAATVSRLVGTYGVRWLFVSKLYAVDLRGLRSLSGVVTERFESRNYAVFRVLD